MKRRINPMNFGLCLILFLGVAQSGQAQFLNRLKHAVQGTAEDHVTNDASNATDAAIDKAEHPDANKKNGSSSNGNSGNASGNNASASSSSSAPASIKSYQNYDFVPGDTVIFESNLADESIGEIPSQFTMLEGQMDVQEQDGENVIHFPAQYTEFSPRMTKKNYLPDRFTVEFDVKDEKFGLEHLKFRFGDSDGVIHSIDELGFDGIMWSTGNLSMPTGLDLEDHPMVWHHVALAINKNMGKLYVDQYRVASVNNLEGHADKVIIIDEGYENMYIKNVRIAAGGIDNYKKVSTNTRIVMHGIRFDVDKATLKAQSMGSINKIYGLLKKDPSLKFEIDGHTDNSGQAAHNLTLSQQRAEAVKTQLVKMGISASRLTTKGYGDTKPISDNDTPEGKANNRRVEFLKV